MTTMLEEIAIPSDPSEDYVEVSASEFAALRRNLSALRGYTFEHTGRTVKVDALLKGLTTGNVDSLDRTVTGSGDRDKSAVYDLMGCDEPGYDRVLDSMADDYADSVARRKYFEGLWDHLEERERAVLQCRFGFLTGEPMTLNQVAKHLHMSHGYVVKYSARGIATCRKLTAYGIVSAKGVRNGR